MKLIRLNGKPAGEVKRLLEACDLIVRKGNQTFAVFLRENDSHSENAVSCMRA